MHVVLGASKLYNLVSLLVAVGDRSSCVFAAEEVRGVVGKVRES